MGDHTPTIRKIFILRAIYANILCALCAPVMRMTEYYTGDLQFTAMVGIGILTWTAWLGLDCLVAFSWLHRKSEEQAIYLELSKRGDL